MTGPNINHPPIYPDPEYKPLPTYMPLWLHYRRLARNTGIAALIFGALGFWAGRASAEVQCAARDQVLSLLTDKYGETVQSAGVVGDGLVMEVYASDITGTWTITMTLADGQMCLVTSGIGYNEATGVPAGSKI